MVDLLVRGVIDWPNFRMALRPSQVSVLNRRNKIILCDRATERMAFGEN